MSQQPASASVHLWLRAETKEHEHRVALTPDVCKKLLAEHPAFQITVERSSERYFADALYEQAGCTLADAGSWKSAPLSAYIVGLKELPLNDVSPLRHRHIYFGHAYKNQAGWQELLGRFKQGNGQLLDLEFLNDEKGRRVAAFGYMAGFAGAAIGLDVWAHQRLDSNKPYPAIKPYANDEVLISYLKNRLSGVSSGLPKVLVIGALGRCGTGACDLLVRAGLPESHIARWDMAETKAGGPFHAILEYDILINCIYLSSPIPPFLTSDVLRTPKTDTRKLTVVVDVSCDVTNPHNPLPFYSDATTFDNPILHIADDRTSSPLDVVAIDHLPTLLPAESSTRFALDLYSTIVELENFEHSRVWKDVQKLFETKAAAAGL